MVNAGTPLFLDTDRRPVSHGAGAAGSPRRRLPIILPAVRVLRSRRSLLVAAVLVVALSLRVAQVQRSSYVLKNDARSYLTLAGAVARTGDYPTSSKPGTGSGGTRGPSALFPPAFPYFLALIDLLDGHTLALGPGVGPARVSQAVLGTIIVGLIGLVALEAFGCEVGLAALALAAVYPVLIETSGTLLAENLLIAFELAAVYCGLRIRRAVRPYRWIVLAGVFTGLAALTHENGVLLLPPLAVTAWSSVASTTSKIRALVAPAVMTLAVVLTVTPWTVRNALELHEFIPISDQAGETLLGTYNAVSAADHQIPYRWLSPSAVTTARTIVDQAPRLAEPDWENRLLSQAFRYIGAHPLSPVAVTFHNTLRLLDLEGSFAWEASTASIGLRRGTAEVGVLSFWVFAILAVLGALTSYARRAPRWIWTVPILFALSTVWVRVETPRFRLPIDPFLVLLAACAVASCATRLRESARRRAPATTPARPLVGSPSGRAPAVSDM